MKLNNDAAPRPGTGAGDYMCYDCLKSKANYYSSDRPTGQLVLAVALDARTTVHGDAHESDPSITTAASCDEMECGAASGSGRESARVAESRAAEPSVLRIAGFTSARSNEPNPAGLM